MKKKYGLKKWKQMLRVIISGGGTGGHVFPAIAIADAIVEMVPSANLLFVGANGKLEMEKVPQAGYNIKGLNIVGFQRSFSLKNVAFPFKLVKSLVDAWSIVRGFRPDVVVGVGGYASGPVLKMANLLGIPTVLQEQNSFAGVTNRLLAEKACKICVAYEGMSRFFPSERIVFTGNPVRKGLLAGKIPSAEAKRLLGLPPEKPVVLLFGGSLGARTINNAMIDNAGQIETLTEYSFIWQVGRMYFQECSQSTLAKCSHIRMLPFIENMDLVYSAADLVVCRAGALTISELSLLGKASVLIPSPNVAEDHQTANARALADKNATVLLRDQDAGGQLVAQIKQILENEPMRLQLETNIHHFARPDAALQIAKEVLACSKTRSDGVK